MLKQNYLEVFINEDGNVVIKTDDNDDPYESIVIEKCDIEILISGLHLCLEELGK